MSLKQSLVNLFVRCKIKENRGCEVLNNSQIMLVTRIFPVDIPQISRLLLDAAYRRLIGGLSAGYLRNISLIVL